MRSVLPGCCPLTRFDPSHYTSMNMWYQPAALMLWPDHWHFKGCSTFPIPDPGPDWWTRRTRFISGRFITYPHRLTQKTKIQTLNTLTRTLFNSKEAYVPQKDPFLTRFHAPTPAVLGTRFTAELLSEMCQFNAPLGFSPQKAASHMNLRTFYKSYSNAFQNGVFIIDPDALPSLKCRLFQETRSAAGTAQQGGP